MKKPVRFCDWVPFFFAAASASASFSAASAQTEC